MPHSSQRGSRGNPLLQEQSHDPYARREKLTGSTLCSDCGALYLAGRWTWRQEQARAVTLCPACRRMHDYRPAGELVLRLAPNDPTLESILHRLAQIAAIEGEDHPLHRIMSIDRDENQTIISTTDIHLPHRFGHAIKDAWGGDVETHYDSNSYFTRVVWEPAAS